MQDVLAGNFMIYESQRQKVARGKNLGVARAENKVSRCMAIDLVVGLGLSMRVFVGFVLMNAWGRLTFASSTNTNTTS